MPALRRICGRLRRGVRHVREDRVSGLRSAYLYPLRRLSGHRRFALGNRQLSRVAAGRGRPSQCRLLVLRSCSGQALCVDIIAETEEPVQGAGRCAHRFCTVSPLFSPAWACPALTEEERFHRARRQVRRQREFSLRRPTTLQEQSGKKKRRPAPFEMTVRGGLPPGVKIRPRASAGVYGRAPR